MPYVVALSANDDRSVSKEFDPPIAIEHMRQLAGTRQLSTEGLATIPTRLRIGKARQGGIPHILGWSMGPWIVSPRVAELIAQLEPSVQNFRSIALVDQNSDRKLASYFLILPPPALDAIIVEETDFSSSATFRRGGLCTLNGAAIRGHHFWRGVGPLTTTYFCSDELHDKLLLEQLDGWAFRHHCRIRKDS